MKLNVNLINYMINLKIKYLKNMFYKYKYKNKMCKIYIVHK
jgi:hypothetical protein